MDQHPRPALKRPFSPENTNLVAYDATGTIVQSTNAECSHLPVVSLSTNSPKRPKLDIDLDHHFRRSWNNHRSHGTLKCPPLLPSSFPSISWHGAYIEAEFRRCRAEGLIWQAKQPAWIDCNGVLREGAYSDLILSQKFLQIAQHSQTTEQQQVLTAQLEKAIQGTRAALAAISSAPSQNPLIPAIPTMRAPIQLNIAGFPYIWAWAQAVYIALEEERRRWSHKRAAETA